MSQAGTRALLPEAWQIQLPEFEGPLDLLLQLVKINEVEITDIPVATICDQFHEYLGLMEELNLDVAADYILEAAMLIFLKSKMLLPSTPLEGEPDAEELRQQLVTRLLEYRRIKQASQSLAEIHNVRMGVWTRKKQPLPAAEMEEGIDFGDVSLFDLMSSLKNVLLRYDHDHPPAMYLRGESFSVRDQFERLLERLDTARPFDLLSDLRSRSCRSEVVAAFLAVLEMARLNLVRFHRTDAGDILLQRTARELELHELEAISG